MTLTLYTLHVVALAAEVGPERGPSLYWLHVGFALAFGVLWRTGVGQGPLELGTAQIAKLGSDAVRAVPGGDSDPERDETRRPVSEAPR